MRKYKYNRKFPHKNDICTAYPELMKDFIRKISVKDLLHKRETYQPKDDPFYIPLSMYGILHDNEKIEKEQS
jgi:hypothetical protein